MLAKSAVLGVKYTGRATATHGIRIQDVTRQPPYKFAPQATRSREAQGRPSLRSRRFVARYGRRVLPAGHGLGWGI